MPLIEPKDGLREKLLVVGGGGSGKTTAALSIAYWAFITGDTRKFYIADTDDESVLQVMAEDKYQGMVYSVNGEVINEGGNVIIHSLVDWNDYADFSEFAVTNAVKGDWIVLDFITHFWAAAQDGFIKDFTRAKGQEKSRNEVLYEAGVKGHSGWGQFAEAEMNWVSINSAYAGVVQPILLKSRAHIFMASEEEEIRTDGKTTPEQKAHIQSFGGVKFVGQKKLPYQCRSYLRIQQLARGRVLFTLKDRARPVYKGETIEPDFFRFYLGAAGWTVQDPA